DQGMLPTPKALDDLDAMEEVVFVGYPNGIYDQQNLTPVARRGTLATPYQLDWNGRPEFMIDASVFGGSSGSPVFINQSSWMGRTGTLNVGAIRFMFLGVVCAVAYATDTGEIRVQGVPTQGVVLEYKHMLDLGIVIKSPLVFETIDHWFKKTGVIVP